MSVDMEAPLHEAVKRSNADRVEMLLEHRAGTWTRDRHGKTPLCHAIEAFARATRVMMEMKIITKALKGVDAEGLREVVVDVRDVVVKPCCIDTFVDDLARSCSLANNVLTNGYYISRIRTLSGPDSYKSLRFSACDTDRDELVLLLRRKDSPRDRGNVAASHRTPLYVGTAASEKRVLRTLLDNGACVDSENGAGKSVLLIAVEAGCSKIVALLLKYRPSMNLKSNRASLRSAIIRLHGEQSRGKIGLAPASETHPAIEYRRIIDHLVDYGFKVEARDPRERSFVTAAVATGFVAIVADLLNYGADVDELHVAANNGQTEMAKLLIKHGANVNSRDCLGKTPLYYAVRNVDVDTTRLLLDCGATIEERDHLLGAATVMGSKEIVDMIFTLKPDIDIDFANKDGVTPLHCTVIDKGDFSSCLFDFDRLADTRAKSDIADALLERGAAVNARTRKGATPVLLAVKKRCAAILKNLLSHGGVADCVDEKGNAALHVATSNNDHEIVKFLLKFGANVNIRNKDGKTALHIACEKANVEITSLLLEYDADVNIGCHATGDTPLIGVKTVLDRMTRERRSDGKLMDHKNIMTMLKLRLMKLVALDRRLSEPNMNWIETTAMKPITELPSDRHIANVTLDDCIQEGERMRNERIGNSSVRFADILAKSVAQVATYARNETIVQILESKIYNDIFPIYSCMIDQHFERGKRRLFLVNSGVKIFRSYSRYELPEVVACEIFGYLRDDDLENFIAAGGTTADQSQRQD